MNEFSIVANALNWIIVGVGCWLGWQLLRQNGRMLLRLDELEKRLDELEFGEQGSQPNGPDHEEARANRFNQHTLANSRIKRDGLKSGTPAPDFRLPRLDGKGELSLRELRSQRVLLVFSDPHCGPCNHLAPQLERFHREHPQITVLMISRGEPKENRAKVKEHGLTFPVVLQQRWEISRRYAMFATPIAYLLDKGGVIASEVVVGVEPVLGLLASATNHAKEKEVVPV